MMELPDIDHLFDNLKDVVNTAFEDQQIIIDWMFDDDYMDCFMQYKSPKDERLILTGNRWHRLLGMSKQEIANTPLERLVHEDCRDFAIGHLRKRDDQQNKAEGDFTHFVVKFQGKKDPFYVKWFLGRSAKKGGDISKWSAEETTKEEYDEFMEKYA